MDKNQTKLAVQKLVDKYEEVLRSGTKNKYTEEETKKGFIVPLFTALGWDMEEKSDVSAEEHISGDRVDYGFYINGRPKFYLETKPFKADLNDAKYARQAIKYSWNKGVTWAVLSDFESTKVFNADFQSEELAHSKFFEISWDKYIEDFDRLWLLSKKSFGDGEIDRKAEEWGKSLKRVSVTDALYKDLTECRKLLTESLKLWNEKVSDDLLDEGVQKLLNRLVFIRVLEDRNIEPHILKNVVREWEAGHYEKSRPPLYLSLVKKFRELDAQYNSNLFDEHPFEKWDEHDNKTKKVIDILYGKSGYYEYDFKIMPADILGAVYENYLGYKLEQLKKGSKVGQDSKKRKEHGIYYTPEFIVDYIIKNALWPVLRQCGTIDELMKIKVLDPACGSGSFLIKAVDAVYQRYYELGHRNSPTYKKIQIITQNIYGVDLDQQAVEIARLNLLINAVEEKVLLPSLAKNVKNGNSLISGTDEELEKYFGKNWRDKKPFNWSEEFPEVFKQGGFDVVIGNPPWGAEIKEEDKNFFKNRFLSGKGIVDTYSLFIEKALSLLKQDGKLGFVLPDIVLLKNYPQIRKLILDTCKILNIYYTGMAFKDVNIDTVVFNLSKEKSDKLRENNFIKVINGKDILEIKQKIFKENDGFKFNLFFDEKTITLKQKLDKVGDSLGSITEIHEGVHSGNIREKLFINQAINKNCKKLLFKGIEIERYIEKWAGKYVNYDKSIINKSIGEYANLGKPEYFENEKILVRRTGDKIIATIDYDKYVVSNNFFVVYNKGVSEINLESILAILNSKLGTWYFTAISPRKGKLFAEIKINHLSHIPIPGGMNKSNLKKLVESQMSTKKSISQVEENSEKWNQLKFEIEKTDKLIDQKVYELYGLTEEEIKIVEG